jgi:6-pyruvoyltetrahydropterin/6-carboxytetrahydropterin synthase
MRAAICKRFDFAASHYLPNHAGLCRQLHGHNFAVEVWVAGEPSKEEGASTEGMVLEFAELKRLWERDLEPRLDHCHLNETLPPAYMPPSTENVALFIYDAYEAEDIPVSKVVVHENARNSAQVPA